ncbi:MAG: hypothetical protein LBC97_11085 [Bifidobacteriaceae bacterium]|jgi:hypothetical protein|nr:hypothetical protein [Bifidobacteriaceae bacterium]
MGDLDVSTRRPRRASVRLSDAVAALTLLALAAAPAGAAVWIANVEDPLSQAAAAVEPVYGLPQAATLSGSFEAVLSLEWAPGRDLVAPAWQGTVTGVDARPGDVLANGQSLLRVDGIARLALVTDQPFWRFLGPGDLGADVLMLNQALAALGLGGSEGEDWTASTSRGVQDLQSKRLGIAKPNLVDGFDPAWVIWLPEADTRLGEVGVTVGSPAPAAGEPVATGRQSLTGAELRDLEGNVPPLDDEQPWVFETSAPEGAFDLEGSALPQDVLVLLQEQVAPGAESVAGVARYKTPREVVSVPTTAVLAQGERTCVWTQPGSGRSGRPRGVPVDVVSGNATATFVATPLDQTVGILVNPAALPDLPPCA